MAEVKINFDGLKDAKAALQNKSGQIPLNELFNDQFMRNHTDFQSFAEMLERSGLDPANFLVSEDWAALFPAQCRFGSPMDMLHAAGAARVATALDK